jgi:hypothetical protein
MPSGSRRSWRRRGRPCSSALGLPAGSNFVPRWTGRRVWRTGPLRRTTWKALYTSPSGRSHLPTIRRAPGELIPVRVRECEVAGLLKAIVYIDLVGQGGGSPEASSGGRAGAERNRSSSRFPGAGPGKAGGKPFPVASASCRHSGAAAGEKPGGTAAGDAATDTEGVRRTVLSQAFGDCAEPDESDHGQVRRPSRGPCGGHVARVRVR